MTRSVFSPSAITSASVIVLAFACGHSQQSLDAYNKAKSGQLSTATSGSTNTGATGGDTGTGGSTGGSGNMPGTGGTGMTGQQFDCTMAASQQFDPDYMKPYSVPADVVASVQATINSMSPAEQATQMLGITVNKDNPDYQDIERSPDVTLSGGTTIRGYNYRDAGKGVNLDAGQKNRPDDMKDYATVFPAPSIRAASWDMKLEKQVGEAAGDETAASKNNMLLAPCMNIIRHPYWGRTQETYGEDSYHIGRMASAYTVGLQEYVTGCAKHFAANNIERFRSKNNAIMNEQTLREIYSRHFEMVVQDAGVGCVMASYNLINSVKSTQNPHLLRDILKAPIEQGGMGYQGLVISDWWAMPGDQTPADATAQSDTNDAAKAGLDIEVPWQLHYSPSTLSNPDLTDNIKEAATRILTQKFRFHSATDEDQWSIKAPTSSLTNGGSGSSIDPATSADHETLAETMELDSAVLLTNGMPPAAGMPATPVLPLKTAMNIAVIGPDSVYSLYESDVAKSCDPPTGRGPCTFHFATDASLGDRGSSRVNGDPARSISPFKGVQMAAPMGATVTPGNAVAAVPANADAIVVVVGYTPNDEGEEYAIAAGGDRASLDLPPYSDGMNQMSQNDFVMAALALGKPTVIIVESGSIVNMPWLTHQNTNQATIWAGYGGLRGGAALGRLIFSPNHENFSGKVPLAWPTQAELDRVDPNTGAKILPFKETDTETHMGYFFGYREYDRRKAAGMNPQLVFPFGHGLSYSTFAYSALTVPCGADGAKKDGILDITVDIQNTSQVDGQEVAMLFVKPPAKPTGISGDRPVKELKSFAKVAVPAGGKTTAHLPLRIRDLRRWEGDDKTGRWTIDSGAYTIEVGKDADDADSGANQATLMVTGY
jgi:beta-glucosidase